MYISHSSFLEKINKYQPDTTLLISYFETTLILFQKYGKRLQSKEILEHIHTADNSLGNLLLLLKNHNKLSLKTIKTYLSFLKKNSGSYTKKFIISSTQNNNSKDIEKYLLKKTGNCDIQTEIVSDLEFKIKGDGYTYKRSLSHDLDKLLA